jgi:hypothetical protein
MVGIIRRREQVKVEPSFNPDDIFDSTTHIATEEDFMKLLDHGIYDTKYIGYKVQLSNSVDYNNGIWIIADVNHDSTNTGQSNCYDLISQDCFYSTTFSSSNNSWRNSNPRTWLNNTFYPGFSNEFKNHILNPKYNSQGTWYTDDKIILPSKVEINSGSGSADIEGVAYPIFTDNTSRIKNQFGGSAYYWWTRSRYTGYGNYVWVVRTGGGMNYYSYGNSYYLAPVLRIS